MAPLGPACPDEGAAVEVALSAQRQWLTDHGEVAEPTWADALVAMAERSLGATGAPRARRDRHVVVVHLRADHEGAAAHLYLGPALPDALRRLLGCDGWVRANSMPAPRRLAWGGAAGPTGPATRHRHLGPSQR